MSEQPMVQLERLAMTCSESFQLEVPDLTIVKGQVFCLLGPTGAGKSTLLRLIAAIQAPTAGQVLIDGVAVHGNGSTLHTRRRMAMVFQRPLLLHASVRTNVEYGLRIRGTLDKNAEKVDEALRRLQLTKLSTQSAHTLSGGQAQLVALARALVIEPDLLILDEPTANLDPAHVALVEEVIAQDREEHETTVVWATHNLFQARRVSQRVALLLDGQIVEEAATGAFFDTPSDPRTADFVDGRMIY